MNRNRRYNAPPPERAGRGPSALCRRVFLGGLGGATLALPWLEGTGGRLAQAEDAEVDTFAIFFRQANGVAREVDTVEIGAEPERFWPRQAGPLTEESVAGRALDELGEFLPRILAVKNVNMKEFPYGDGHARGALQGLTARGPVIPNVGGGSEADGESLDHRIGRELNPDGRDSLFLYVGPRGGWLGGPCISYRGSNNRRSAIHDPFAAYLNLVGSASGLSEEAVDELTVRNRSVNDLVREELTAFLRRTDLSRRDRQRLDLHLTSIRDVEGALSCQLLENREMELAGMASGYQSTDGDLVLAAARAHLDVAVLSVACGYTRSVALQVGPGNDGLTRYRDDTGKQMENFHYVSHRRRSDDAAGTIISGSDELHHQVDRQFARTFAHLLEKLDLYRFGDKSLLDYGVAVWYNDLGDGPAHSPNSAPVIIAGSCGGYFKQGECIELGPAGWTGPRNHARVLNTIATAVGCRTDGEDVCRDFGDESLDRSPHPDLKAS